MSTILSIETPDELRALDAYLNRDSVRGRIVLSVILAAAAPFGLLFAVLGGSVIGVVVAFAWAAFWTGWIIRIWYRLRAARPYRIPVIQGVQQIGEAHNLYRRLSTESSSREYALPLVKAMYRISTVPVIGPSGEQHLVELMQERVEALQRLLAAEDRVAIASAGEWANDRDDLGAVQAYQDALNEVAAMLNTDV